jgi:hypothetical protein
MIDGPYEVLDLKVVEPCVIAELAEKMIMESHEPQVLTFSIKKVQINGRTFDVSTARIDWEDEAQRPLLRLSVSIPHHAQSRNIRAQSQNSRRN